MQDQMERAVQIRKVYTDDGNFLPTYGIMAFMSILNTRFGDAGLQNALVQSSIVAEGSVDSALHGKSYNRGIRLHKIYYEALNRLLLKHLEDEAPEMYKEF